MLTPQEEKLLRYNIDSFPLLKAVASVKRSCSKCRRPSGNITILYRAAILRLKEREDFRKFVKINIGFPVMLGGVLFKDEKQC